MLQLETMPGCVGSGVVMPLPGLVVVVVGIAVLVALVGVGVGVKPITPTQKYASAHMDWQLSPTPVFHVVNCFKVMPYFTAISEQNSPGTCKWNLLQFSTIPGCVGRGVVTPLPGLVLVGVDVGGAVVGEPVGVPVGSP